MDNENIIDSTHSVEVKKSKVSCLFYDKFPRFILLTLTFLLPVFFIPPSFFQFIPSKGILISSATIIVFLLWLVARLRDGNFELPNRKVLFFSFSIILIYLISSLFSGSINSSLIGQGFEVGTFSFILVSLVLMFLVVIFFKDKVSIRSFYTSLMLSFLVITIFQVVQLLGLLESLLGVTSNSNFNLIGKWNELGLFYGLGAILGLIDFEYPKNSKFVRFVGFLILIVSFFFIAIVNFVVVWWIISIFSLVLFVYILSLNKLKLKDGRRHIPVLSLIIFFISLIFALNSGLNNILPSFFQISNVEVRPSVQSTLGVVKGTFLEKKFLGAGPNQFDNQWLKFKPNSINETAFWDTDFATGFSFVFSSLVTVGFLGFSLWIAFIFFLIYWGVKLIFFLSKDKEYNQISLATFVSVLYFWLFAILYVPGNVIFALTFIFTGLFISILHQRGLLKLEKFSTVRDTKVDFISVLVLIAIFIFSVVGGYFILQKFIASTYFQKISITSEGKDLSILESDVSMIARLSNNDFYYRTLVDLNLMQLQELLSKSDITEDDLRNQFQTTLSKAIGNARLSVEADKTNYKNWVVLGKVYEAVIPFGIQGAYEEAKISYEKAIELNPKNLPLIFSIGVLEYNSKDYDGSVSVLEKVIAVNPIYSNAKYYLGLSYEQVGEIDLAVIQFEEIQKLNPDVSEVKDILRRLYKKRES
ncbi:tetratricopeptide repeat protein [Patescibacteria group bacterium]